MNASTSSSRPKRFWIIAVLALLWNLLGLAMFVMQVTMSPEAIAALPREQREVYEASPAWLDIAFAVAVFGGVLGAIGLSLKKRWAARMFLLSLIGLLVQMLSAYVFTPAWAAYGAAGLVMPLLLVVVAVLLLGTRARRLHAAGSTETLLLRDFPTPCPSGHAATCVCCKRATTRAPSRGRHWPAACGPRFACLLL